MKKTLKVLIVEDSEDDTELLIIELERGGYQPIYQRVENSVAMAKALLESDWEIVIADYQLPQFSAIAALNLLKQQQIDIPFIIVSGKIGEETAVDAMKAGVHDYLVKHKLARLIPAVQRELKEATVRKQHRQAQARLEYLAFYDELTGLPNRTLYLDHLQRLIADSAASNLFAVVVFNLSRYKIIKYSLGHPLAEQLLIATAQRLKSCLEPQDLVARISIEEFAILCTNIADLQAVKQKAQLIRQQLTQAFDLDGRIVFSQVNIGIALSTAHLDQAEQYLQAADTAMHYATQSTGGVAIFNSTMHQLALQRLHLETELQQAVRGKQLHLNYQPIVCLYTDKIIGFEALVRWQHPHLGLVSPNEFMPLSEETGLIIPLGHWVLYEACRRLTLWQKQFPQQKLIINVNLSGIQIVNQNFVKQVDDLLKFFGLSGEGLKLEITESVLMDNASETTYILEQLKQRKIKLCIDDFGTGYSSLSYLHCLPIDTLKIDRSFIVSCDPKNLDIVRAIITLAHNLGLDVVAEGIETKEQLDWLKSLECDYGQGYLFSKPIDAESAFTLLNSYVKEIK